MWLEHRNKFENLQSHDIPCHKDLGKKSSVILEKKLGSCYDAGEFLHITIFMQSIKTCLKERERERTVCVRIFLTSISEERKLYRDPI